MAKIKNILIFVGILVVLVLVYFFVFKKGPEEASLVSTTGGTVATTATINTNQSENEDVSKNFLSVLLNVRNIKIDDSIFSDPAFLSLRDSTIELVSDGTEGRPNPFAPLGTDITPVSSPNNLVPATVNNSTTTTTETNSNTTAGTTPTMPTVENSGNTSSASAASTSTTQTNTTTPTTPANN